MRKALSMKSKHMAVNEKFNTVLSVDLRRDWAGMISEWERDKRKPNPYVHTEKGMICRPTTFTPLY